MENGLKIFLAGLLVGVSGIMYPLVSAEKIDACMRERESSFWTRAGSFDDKVKACVDMRDQMGKTLLMQAVSGQDSESAWKEMNFLLNLGADRKAVDNEGNTALLLALKSRNKSLAITLATSDTVNIANAAGERPLSVAVRNFRGGGVDLFLLQKLLVNGALVRPKDKRGKTALDYARESGHTEVIRELEKAQQKQIASLPFWKRWFQRQR